MDIPMIFLTQNEFPKKIMLGNKNIWFFCNRGIEYRSLYSIAQGHTSCIYEKNTNEITFPFYHINKLHLLYKVKSKLLYVVFHIDMIVKKMTFIETLVLKDIMFQIIQTMMRLIIKDSVCGVYKFLDVYYNDVIDSILKLCI